ncbi:MAG: 2-amino-4-hydroxy-6-hydroxymethyldihydropteridine diphosphokinase [Parabacteroides sp.]|uniref:2-amino-4-hydroxy-6-hydroxymethyldihydropteridine pyrophosphokinase n=1 Tax=Parabacteroides faecalis TaxID=2924040 RepID=A0ABT0C1X3_9BACT|nr:2-amino-4-hydroxy-6-hydroxymethyldihydropteridine diphosphokinase [Parabacteroides faecalis]MCI7285836.1 2-amino-4-hydroxy-6-hydroxymethyldihydropteridine diphosphokinase [Parabacteroides sp.]MCJ2380991.1 2-amino-4-hydroxy-6-hydroxymethyldihydropteridine diphosphokinase [Parabacteroides faecalis]MDD7561648.1 2-amino-4-hydroxy-6-hydroxymethyldihydropteridine diphosphokinase [Parabacteroides sp.]MDY6256153.1 2-amino-4-hydroxy-6-hydroxymethyldihydropteridine diphosphokinase [Bacteroidales bacte
MALVYLGLGTNIGNKRKNMVTAAALLAERAGDVLSLSSFYETEPWGFASENTFLNAALELETDCSPMELLRLTQQIEREMGRTQKSDGSYHDRIIDIDILLYGNEVVHHEDLVVPHPLMQQRLFVMQPLAEIAPSLVHPVLQKSMYDLYMDLLDGEDSEVK